ncbi:hypothetical protein ACI1TW_03235 [Lactococcus garvieae]|uniref:hypothetical protein n=1 Tax=Lactococcus garvieae TaxID=1363 RepID=UPI003853E18C
MNKSKVQRAAKPEIKKETGNPFEGMSFKYPPVSKEHFFTLYEDYARRCSTYKLNPVITIDAEVEPSIEDVKGLHDSIVNIVREEIKNTLQNNIKITMQSGDSVLESVEEVSNKIVQVLQNKKINL